MLHLLVVGSFGELLFWGLYHASHLVLHQFEIVDEFIFALVLDVTHLLPNLLLKRSVALRLDWLQFAVY